MSYQYVDDIDIEDASKITISTWIYISQAAFDAAQTAGDPTLDERFAKKETHQKLPIMEFGKSVEPRLGIASPCSTFYKAYLGLGLWYGGSFYNVYGTHEGPTDDPAEVHGYMQDLPGRIMICTDPNCRADGMDNWWPVYNSATILVTGLTKFFYTDAGFQGSETEPLGYDYRIYKAIDQYHGATIGGDRPPPQPVVHWEGWERTGLNKFGITDAADGDFPLYPFGVHFGGFHSDGSAVLESWSLSGAVFALNVKTYGADFHKFKGILNTKNIATLEKDKASDPHLIKGRVETLQGGEEIDGVTLQYFNTPTELIRSVDTGKGGNFLASPTHPVIIYSSYAYLISPFPKIITIPGGTVPITYGEPAIPSSMVLDPGKTITVCIAAPWPKKTTDQDPSIIPLEEFRGTLPIVLDSWNHIFFTVDLTKQNIDGAKTGEGKDTTGKVASAFGLYKRPYLATGPKWSLFINGNNDPGHTSSDEIDILGIPSFINGVTYTFPVFTTNENFKMALKGGQIGFPVIKQEVDHWKVSGPNQKIRYGNTQIWFDQYIDPKIKENLDFFVKKSLFVEDEDNKERNYVMPPVDKKAAQNKFGDSDVWLYRDRDNDIKFQDNQGKMKKDFTVIGKPKNAPIDPSNPDAPPKELKPPFDFRPGPGQPKKKDQTIDG